MTNFLELQDIFSKLLGKTSICICRKGGRKGVMAELMAVFDLTSICFVGILGSQVHPFMLREVQQK